MLLKRGLSDLIARAQAQALPSLAPIDGKTVTALCGATFDNIGPRDGALLNQVSACGPHVEPTLFDQIAPSSKLAREEVFGGFKQSGFGRDRSPHALHKYADLKSISITLRPS